MFNALMNTPNATPATGLTLSDYFDELNDQGAMTFTELDDNSKYYDQDSLNECQLTSKSFLYKSLHLNIRGLPSKFEELKSLICNLVESNIDLDFILLCETFLLEANAHLYKLPGFNLLYKCRNEMPRGGVAIYVKENLKYKLREDLSLFCEGEFESIFFGNFFWEKLHGCWRGL